MFDIKQLLASPGINRLLQPLLMGGGQGIQPSNMLAGAGQMQAPVPLMPVQAPAAQMQPQQHKPGLMDRYNAFTESDRGRTLNDFFLGLAMGSNPNQSLAGAAQMVATGRAERAGKKNQNQTVEWLMAQGMSPEEAQMVAGQPNVLSEFLKQRMKGGQQSEYEQRAAAAQQYGLDPNSPDGQAFILSGDIPEARGGAAEMSLNTIPIVTETGEAGLLQVDKAGNGHVTKLPPGTKIAKAPMIKDTGTEFQVIDPVTREVVQTIQKNVAGAAAQEEIGTAQGKAAAAAPGDIQAGRNALDLVESLRSDPSRQRGTGMSSVFNAIPGTAGYDYASKVNQAKSGAFLSAIQQLRGMGALSNAEGETATKAITRLDTAMSEEAFLAALNDYETILRQGLAKAERMAERFGIETPPMAIPNNGPVDYRDYFGGK